MNFVTLKLGTKKNTHLDINSVVHTTTTAHRHTSIPIKNIAIIALATFIALCRALDWHRQAGTGEITRLRAYFIVAVGWATVGCGERN